MNEHRTILVIDDEQNVAAWSKGILEEEGYSVRTASRSEEPLAVLNDEAFDCILVELVGKDTRGLDLIQKIKQHAPQTIVIGMADHAARDVALEALGRGAYDCLMKPCPGPLLTAAVKRGLQRRELGLALNEKTRQLQAATTLLNEQTGQIAAIHRLSGSLHRAARLDDALSQIAQAVKNSLGFGRVLVSLINRKEGVMERRACAGLTLTEFQDFRNQKPPLNEIGEHFKEKYRVSLSYLIPHDDSGKAVAVQGGSPIPRDIGSGPDPWHPGDLFFTPLLSDQEELLGIISVDDPQNKMLPSRTTIKILEAFAATASMAIERIALEEKLSAINELSRELALALDHNQIYDIVLRTATRVLIFDNIAVIRIDEQKKETYIAAHIGYPREVQSRRLSLDEQKGITIQAIRSGEPLLVPDVRDNAHYLKGRPGTRSELAVPMKVKGKIMGALNVESSRFNAFDSKDVALLSALASQAATALEITELVREINQTKNYALNLINSCPDAIISTDREGRFTYFSQMAEHLFGYPAEEVKGRQINDFCTPSGGEPQSIMELLEQKGQLKDHEIMFRAKNNTEVPTSLSASLLVDEDGRTIGSIGICTDMTERRAFEEEQHHLREQLAQSEKLSALGEFIAGIAHELNNPLTGVLGFSQLLLQSGCPQDVSADLEKIHREALRCQQIVSNLLSFAREQRPQRVSVHINALLENALGLKSNQLRTHGVTVLRDFESDLPPILADPHQLEQVFLNIITNAYEAMSRGDDRRSLTVRTEQQEHILRIKFIDTGPGIAPENLKRIFDPFYTTKDVGQGTGLGLSLAYGYIQEHEGSIYATSKGGGGTTVVIELPVSGEPEPVSPEPSRELGKPPATGRILVVDDEPVVLDLLTEILRQLGYHVDTASNGKKALRLIRENQFDVIVTDLKMPGMDGQQLFNEISMVQPELTDHIVFITGYALSPDMQAFLKSSGRQYIEKPFDINVIRHVIEDHL